MSNDTNIAGGRQLDDLLKTLAPKVQKNIMRAALRAGATVYRNKAKDLVPERLGALKKSIRISTGTKQGITTASVKAGNRKTWYVQLVEYGTRAHKIKARNARALTIGGALVREVEHPGSAPKPFMRPAADSSHAEAVAAVAAKVRERLTLEGINVPAPEPV